MLKEILGIAPKPTGDGAYSPSRLALKLATSSKTDFDGTVFDNPNQDEKLKVLMLCTEERHMTMANGKKFSTGNHPVEMLLPCCTYEMLASILIFLRQLVILLRLKCGQCQLKMNGYLLSI